MKKDKMQAKVKKVMREKMHKLPDGKMMKNSDMTKKGY